MRNQSETLLSMKNIHLTYRDKKALKGVDFELYPGEIHAIAGAHRAGKSSLVKILSGAVRKNEGTIVLNGNTISYLTPRTSMLHGIGIVYQHLNIIPSFNAVENIFAGQTTSWLWNMNSRTRIETARSLLSTVHQNFDVTIPVNRLTKTNLHMIELARALSINPTILILDELSSKLNPDEMEKIYPILLSFKNLKKSVIYISQNIDELFEIADRVTILNNGNAVDTERIENLDRNKLVKLTYSFVLSSEELKKQNQELFYFKKYNENIIKNIPVGVLILDTENNIYLINYAATKIFGLSHDQISGQSVHHLFDPMHFKEKDAIMEALYSKEKLMLEDVVFDEDTIVKISLFPFKDTDFAFLGTILLIEDISMDLYIKQYMMRAEKIASIAELAAGTAHEINNPLTIVLNYIELLKMKDIDEDGKTKLYKIERELQRIGKIVSSLLTFTKFNEVSNETVNIAEILEEVVTLLDHKIKEKNIDVRIQINSGKPCITGDENKLKQLIMNLLINSIEAVDQNGVIEGFVTSDQPQNVVELSIVDNGVGISSDVIHRIYDPFFSTKENKKNNGLGLTICQHIVELHGGIMTCSSIPGSKTTFNLRFPSIPC